MTQNILRVAMLSTGEEVLHGDILDTNAAWMSKRCFEEGFLLHRRVTVGDSLDDIAVELLRCSQVSDVVIVNGGLGPTTDDVTTQAMAMAMNVELELNVHWLTALKEKYEKNGREMPKSNIKQAMLPEGAVLLDNPMGTACGFFATLKECLFFFTPGVPFEFKSMFENEVLPKLHVAFPHLDKKDIHRFYTFGLSESSLNDRLESLPLPFGYQLGYRSFLPFIEIKIFYPAKHSDIKGVINEVKRVLGEYTVGEEKPMLHSLAERLSTSSKTLAIAEQFSGGYVSSLLQEEKSTRDALVQGWILNSSSDVFIEEYNPLAAILAMAAASRDNADVDIGLACGSLVEGAVALGLSAQEGDWGVIVKARSALSTEQFRCYVSTFLLDMLRRYLEGANIIFDISALETLDALHIPFESLDK